LIPFENLDDENISPSLSYLLFSNCGNSHQAWMELLKREPRAFHWPEVTDRTSIERLYGFNFSNELILKRKTYTSKNHHFKIFYDQTKNEINLKLNEHDYVLKCHDLSFLSVHILLKIILNTHSTLLMGTLNRYESNLMTWVRASNNKLIDRAVRYAQMLLKEKGIEISYNELVHACFKYKDQIKRDESLVLKMVNEFSG
jgi:N-acetylmuramic acid 6-phosphate etherase